MEQLKKYVGREVNLDNIKHGDRLSDFDFACRYLPDPPEDFDEFEFVTSVGTLENLGLMITVQSMKIAKMFFGSIDPDNPDMVTGLSEEQLKDVFDQAEHKVIGLLDYITEPSANR